MDQTPPNIPESLRCVGHLVSLKWRNCPRRRKFLMSGHDAFHCAKQWDEQFAPCEGRTITKELVYVNRRYNGEVAPAGFRYVGHLVAIHGRHCTWKAKLFPSHHYAYHCLKQWKEQHPYYEDCTFTSDPVFIREEAGNE
jgi:hypothetical protein